MNVDMLSVMLGQKQYGKMLYFSPWQWIPESYLRKDEVEENSDMQWKETALCFPTTISPWFLSSKIGAFIFFSNSQIVSKTLVISYEKKNVLELWINAERQLSKEHINTRQTSFSVAVI